MGDIKPMGRCCRGKARVGVMPHAFAPARLRDRWFGRGRCRLCFLPRAEHPTTTMVERRPRPRG